MAVLSGTCTLDGNTVSGAVVYAVDSEDDTVEATTTSDSNGDYTFDLPDGEYHVVAEYEDGSSQYNAFSNPFNTLISSTLTIENWEHGDEPENAGWGGSASLDNFDNQSDSTLEGSRNIVNSDTDTRMSTSNEVTNQGHEYRMRVYYPSGIPDTYVYLAIHAETDDSGPSTNHSYQVLLDQSQDLLGLAETEPSGDSRTTLGTESFTVNDDTEYQMGIRHRDDGDVECAVYDAAGTEQASVDPVTPSNQFGPGAVWIYHNQIGTISDDIRQIP